VISLFRRQTPAQAAAHALFGTLVAQSRLPAFYIAGEVPDTIDGRFDLLALHVSLAIRRLERDPALGPLGQALFEAMVDNLDHGLRKAGVGDLRVGKRVKAMVAAFYGRLKAYGDALDPGAPADALDLALTRNLFRDVRPKPETAAAVANYVRRQDRTIACAPAADLAAGRLGLIPFPPEGGAALVDPGPA
jgi:cytochrome b pre-mRNA-processing protein 3